MLDSPSEAAERLRDHVTFKNLAIPVLSHNSALVHRLAGACCVATSLALAPLASCPAQATRASRDAASPRVSLLPLLGSDSLDRWRLAGLRDSSVRLPLLRSSSSLLAPLAGETDGWRWAWVAPVVGGGIHTGIPRPSGDMPIWTGQGFNFLALGGVRAERGRLRLVLAPTVAATTNSTYALIPATPLGAILAPPLPPDRSEFASPWYTRPNSIDLPLRFGGRGMARLDPGQSALTLHVGGVEVGIATENEWWGPGLRNALVLSDNADGFPHLLLRSLRPWRTPLGFVELHYLLGGLSESAFFDTLSTNDVRSFSGLAIAVRPRGVAGLTVGASRVVYAPVSGWGGVPARALDVFRSTGRPNAVPASDSTMTPGPDQLLSLFGQWVFPEDGFEAFLEVGRGEMPASIRDLLQFPNHTLGYVVGFQWARPVRGAERVLRLQLELTSTEQSPTYRNRPIGTWYTSRRVPQGYTQRGEVLGAMVGPGGSGQWLAADLVTRDWSGGVFVDRVRWNEDARSTRPWLPFQGICEHDVSWRLGTRGGYRATWGTVNGTVATGVRMNTFFDAGGYCFNAPNARDERELSITIRFSPLDRRSTSGGR